MTWNWLAWAHLAVLAVSLLGLAVWFVGEWRMSRPRPEPEHWGACDHGVSLAPWMDCAECETREDDFDA